MSTLVYTCLTCRRDELPQQIVHPPGFDFVCFTDEPDYYCGGCGWQIKPLRWEERCAVLTCRRHKMRPLEHSPGYSHYLWVDAHVSVKPAVVELFDEMGDADFAVFRHRQRTDPYQEIRTAHCTGMETGQNCVAARQLLLRDGYPRNGGMHETGVLLMRATSRIDRMLNDWWNALSVTGATRDQLHFNRLARKHGLTIYEPPGNVRVNRYFNWNCHEHPASPETTRRRTQWTGTTQLVKS